MHYTDRVPWKAQHSDNLAGTASASSSRTVPTSLGCPETNGSTWGTGLPRVPRISTPGRRGRSFNEPGLKLLTSWASWTCQARSCSQSTSSISIGIRRSWTWPHHPCRRAQRNRGHLHLNPDARHWRRNKQPLRAPRPERRQLEHMHLVFRTNLLMAILSFPPACPS